MDDWFNQFKGSMNLYLHIFVSTRIGSENSPEPLLVKAATRIMYTVLYESPSRSTVYSSLLVSRAAVRLFPLAQYSTLYPSRTPFSEPSGIGFHSTIMDFESRCTKRKLVGAALGTKKMKAIHIGVIKGTKNNARAHFDWDSRMKTKNHVTPVSKPVFMPKHFVCNVVHVLQIHAHFHLKAFTLGFLLKRSWIGHLTFKSTRSFQKEIKWGRL